MADRNVDILIGARDEASKSFNAASGSAKRFRQEIDSVSRRVLAGSVALFGLDRVVGGVREAFENAAKAGQFDFSAITSQAATATEEFLRSIPLAGELGALIALTNREYRSGLKLLSDAEKEAAQLADQQARIARGARAEAQAREALRRITVARDISRVGPGSFRAREIERAERLLQIERQLAELRRAAEANIPAGPRQDLVVRDIEEAQRRAREAMEDEAGRDRRERHERQLEIDRQINQERITALEQAAALGDDLARQEAERLRLAERYVQQYDRLQKLIRDPNIAEGQRTEINMLLRDLLAQEKQAVEELRARQAAGGDVGRSAPVIRAFEGRFLSDRPGGRVIREETEKKTEKNTEETKKNTKRTATAAESQVALLRLIERNGIVLQQTDLA